MKVNRSLICNCIVISIRKLSHTSGGTLSARTKSSEVEESTVESVSDVNASTVREKVPIDHDSEVQGEECQSYFIFSDFLYQEHLSGPSIRGYHGRKFSWVHCQVRVLFRVS